MLVLQQWLDVMLTAGSRPHHTWVSILDVMLTAGSRPHHTLCHRALRQQCWADWVSILDVMLTAGSRPWNWDEHHTLCHRALRQQCWADWVSHLPFKKWAYMVYDMLIHNLCVYLVFFKKLQLDNKVTLQAFISLPMQLKCCFNLTNFDCWRCTTSRWLSNLHTLHMLAICIIFYTAR